MKIKFLLLYCCFFILKSSAQEVKLNKEQWVSLNLLSPVYGISPRWELGYMRQINKDFYVRCQGGYGTHVLESYKTTMNRSWSFKPEVVLKLNSGRHLNTYLSLDFFYVNHKAVFYNSYFITKEDDYYSYDKADYHRKKSGTNLNFGVLAKFSDRLGIDFKTGIGFKSRTVNFSAIENLQPSNEEIASDSYILPTISQPKTNEGTYVKFNFSLEALLYYRFN